MNVSCASCSTQYEIDASKVPKTGGFIRCKTCGERVRIPAPGEAPAAPPTADAAIPLAGNVDDAPTAVGPSPAASIPLGGSDDAAAIATGPAPTAGIPLSGSDDDDVETAIGPAPTAGIPLGGSDDNAPTAVTPSPLGAIPLDGTGGDAKPAAPLDDLPAPVDDTPNFLQDLPLTMPDEQPAASPSAAAAGDPLDDLPMAATDDLTLADGLEPLPDSLPAQDAQPFDDLPGLPNDPHTAETTVGPPPVELFDDLPAADSNVHTGDTIDLSDALPAIEDLPAIASDDSGTSMPAEAPDFADLPVVDAEAPRLMDDLPGLDASVPSLMDDPPPEAGPDGAHGQIPGLGPLDREDGKAVSLSRPPEPEPQEGNKNFLYIGGAVAGLLLLLGVVFATPIFGMQIIGGGDDAAVNVDPSPKPLPPKVDPKPDPKPEPKPVPKEIPLLTETNVDMLSYRELSVATKAYASSAAAGDTTARGLLDWARYRMATAYGDAKAKEVLTQEPPKAKELSKSEGLTAAAGVGALVLAGKAGPARKVGEKLQKTKMKESPQLALVLASTYQRRPDAPKAIRQLERALRLMPTMTDAQLERARWMLGGRDASEGRRALADLGRTSEDLDVAAHAALLLLEDDELAVLDTAVSKFTSAEAVSTVSPARRGAYLELLVRKNMRDGDLAAAVTASAKRVEVTPADLQAIIENARLLTATGGDASPVLTAGLDEVEAPGDKARLIAEQVRMALAASKPDDAKKALDEGRKAASGREATPWLKTAEGWIAQAAGDLDAAKAAFAAAGKGKAKLVEPRIAQMLIEEEKAGPLLKKLSEIERRSGEPVASYHLARLMAERGNHGGALELFDRVLWYDPTVVDPMQLLLEWADAVERSGATERAAAMVNKLRQAFPDDTRPVLTLIGMAERAEKHAEALKLYRQLAAKKPDDVALQVSLARAMIGAGQDRQAQAMLDDMFKADAKKRTPAAEVMLARAWMGREPYRAKELLRLAIDKEPLASTYMLLGEVEMANGNADKARIAYKKAMDLDPNLIEPRLLLARVQIEERSYEAAVKALERVLTRNPRHAEAAELLGDALTEMGKPREAVNHYTLALEVVGDRGPLLMKVARLQLQRLGQLQPAVRTMRRAVKANTKLAEPHYYLGLALKDMGKNGEARNELQSYVRLSPDGEFANDARRIVDDLEK